MNHPNQYQCKLSSLQILNVIYERFLKKYRHIRSDVSPVIDQLQAGEVMGDQVPGTHYTIFKVRIRNSNIQKGKRSGYRLIYHVKTSKNIILVTIYSKLNQADISAKQIRRTLIGFDRYNA